LGLAPLGWIGLLLGEITGRALGIARMMRAAWPAIRSSLRFTPPDYFNSILRQNWKSPAVLLPSSLMDALAAMIPIPIISYLFGSEAAGQFFLVQRLSSLPAGLIATSVADVFHPTIANAHWNEPGQVRAILLRVTRKLALASIGIYVPIALISPFVFGFLFGNEWHTAGICMAILSPLSMVSFVVSPVSRLLLVVDKIELKFVFDTINLLVPNIGLFVMNYYGSGFFSCLGVYATFSIGAYIIYYSIIWRESVVRVTQDKCI
jgi:O-antigen/teichoic acid export membrane protein